LLPESVTRLAGIRTHDPDLRVTNQAVYEWLQGHAPQPARALALVEMPQGRLSLEAIYKHAQQVRKVEGPGEQR